MADKKIIKQNGDNPLALINSNISINIETDNQCSEEIKQFSKDVIGNLKETKQKVNGLKGFLTNIINKGFDKLHKSIGFDFALNMNSLQRGGNYAPPLSHNLLERVTTLSSHEPYIDNLTWLHIYGGVLTGKTHYLYLLSKKLNAEKNIWIKCKNLNREQASMTIKLTLAEIAKIDFSNENSWFDKITEKFGQVTVLLIDDLPSFQINDVLFENLAFIYSACKKHGVKIISSGSVSLPQSLTKNFDKDTMKSIQIPLFTIEDIVELIKMKNNTLKNAKSIANWIGSVTKFNPSLVVACVDYIELNNWDITTELFRNIQNGFYSLELNREVWHLLLKDIDDNDTKELLYRLSIINDYFDKKYVDKISAISPQVIHPYDKIQLLEGYWLQRSNEGYRISPFIEKIGVTNLPANIIKEIHSCIAQILKQSKVLSPIDFVKMFSHLVQAEEFNNAANALFLALTELNKSNIEKDYWTISSIWYNIPLPTEIDPELRLLIRAKQIITGLKFNKDVTYLINDLDIIDEKNQFISAIYLMLAFELLDYNVDLSLTYFEKFLSQSNDKVRKLYKENLGQKIEELIWLYPLRIKGDINKTNKLLDLINNMSEKEIKTAFKSDMSYDCAMLLVDNIWLEEARLEENKRNWDRCIQLFNKVKEIGLNKRNSIFYSCAIRALIIVNFEYLNKVEDAVSLYNHSLSFDHDSDSLFLLHSVLGKQYVFKKKYEVATSYILSALQLKSTNYPYEFIETSVFAAKCLEGKNSFEGLRYLTTAVAVCNQRDYHNEIIEIKLLGEIGIYYFNQNMYAEAYNYFKNSLIKLRNFDNKNNYWKSLIVVFSHVLGYVTPAITTGIAPIEIGEKEPYTKPSLGMFWIDNDKRNNFYDYQRELQLNTFMGIIANRLNRCEDGFNWLSISKKELQNHNINDILYFWTKKHLIPHLILKRNFLEAIQYGIEFSIELIARSYSNTPEKNILDAKDINATKNDQERRTQAIEHSIIYVFIPLMFYLSEIKVKNQENIVEITKEVKGYMDSFKKEYTCKTFDSILKVFTMTFLENHESEDFLNGINQYSDNEKVLFYIALSLVMPKRGAMDMHLKCIGYLYDLYSKERLTFFEIITPFYKTFWMYSYIRNRTDFNNTEIIDANLERLLLQKDDNKDIIKSLLNLMNSGLNVQVPDKVLKFLHS